MKFVIFFFTFAIIAIISCYAGEFKCINGESYIENRCNVCLCDGNDALSCTDRLCPSQENKQAKCEVGSTWNEDCNRCFCDEQLGTVCTNNKC